MDYYSTLGVSKNASDKELKQAYKKLSMQHHPDRTGGDDTKFKEINEAYRQIFERFFKIWEAALPAARAASLNS